MKILGIDTSGYVNAVGVIDGGKALADNRFPARTDTLEQIVDNIDVTLKQAALSLKDIDGIGVGLGPGSWTGIKVGVTVGKMLAFSTGKPVAGISSLDALAYGAGKSSLPVYAIIGAGVKDMVYAARYRFDKNEPVREGDFYAGDVRGLASIIRGDFILTGRNAKYYRDLIVAKNEPARYKAEAGGSAPPENNLHNVKNETKFEPAQDRLKRISGEINNPSQNNEPARTEISYDSAKSNNINESVSKNEPAQGNVTNKSTKNGNALNINEPAQSEEHYDNNVTARHYTKNVPVQSGAVYEGDKSNEKTIENEPAGACVATLALLRLQRGMGDNPLVLAPMYLKESTAKVFVNKYLGNKG